MLRIRIAPVSALAAALAIAAAASAANAQIAVPAQPGKPVALLAGLDPPHASKSPGAKAHGATRAETAKTAQADGRGKHVRAQTAHTATTHTSRTRTAHAPAAHAHAVRMRTAEKTAARRHHVIATNERTEQPSPPAPPPEAKWPAPADNPPPIAAAAPPLAAPASNATDPNAVVVNGQAVPIAPRDEINDLDRAAAAQPSVPAQNAALAPGAEPQTAAAAPAAAAPRDGDLQPAMTRLAAAAISDDGSQQAPQSAGAGKVGSASWIAQALAALGGALAAAAVAWFLIGSGPIRTYG